VRVVERARWRRVRVVERAKYVTLDASWRCVLPARGVVGGES
jgi:hypothetical protein